MSDELTGGPAFPILQCSAGMTLRDFFAAKALQGMLAAGNQWSVNDKAVSTTETYAATAYDFADAMLAARATPPKNEG